MKLEISVDISITISITNRTESTYSFLPYSRGSATGPILRQVRRCFPNLQWGRRGLHSSKDGEGWPCVAIYVIIYIYMVCFLMFLGFYIIYFWFIHSRVFSLFLNKKCCMICMFFIRFIPSYLFKVSWSVVVTKSVCWCWNSTFRLWENQGSVVSGFVKCWWKSNQACMHLVVWCCLLVQ